MTLNQPYHFRKCPACGEIFPAGELPVMRCGSGHWHKRDGSLRQCPTCGHVAFTGAFVIVNAARARADAPTVIGGEPNR